MIKKLAILTETLEKNFQHETIHKYGQANNIHVEFFEASDAILNFKPDCVIVTTPQHAKLTPFPTYGLINQPKDSYLNIPRFLRNILTYDAYLTNSPLLKQMLQDIMFGTRKLNTGIVNFDFYPACRFTQKKNGDVTKFPITLFEPNVTASCFKQVLQKLLQAFPQLQIVTFNAPSKKNPRVIEVNDVTSLQDKLSQSSVVICLQSGDDQQEIIFPTVLASIACGTMTIAQHTRQLEKYFGEAIFYIPMHTHIADMPDVINHHLADIDAGKNFSQQAQEIFAQHFSLDHAFENLNRLHAETRSKKGYTITTDTALENNLPSVTYIMRTGGKHRPFLERALNCLLAQNYPDLRVIFVIHAHFPYLQEIIANYPTLKIKVIESIKSRRSEAIRDGMAAVTTALFGLFDDDDELFPNHVRSLVYAMQYHSHRDWRGEIGMVYSGSIHADDTFPVEERIEYRDHHYKNRFEKRALEHFKFYSSHLMSQHKWFMPNGWLARTKLIDEELLTDPALDTCEDLYFELQIAQKAHFAFSMEVTAVHHFHHLGNSTIDDSHKHIPDTERIALRNLGRTFPMDALYDTQYSLVGRAQRHDLHPIVYQDKQKPLFKVMSYYKTHPFYPFRYPHKTWRAQLTAVKLKFGRWQKLPLKLAECSLNFLRLSPLQKRQHIREFQIKRAQVGMKAAIFWWFAALKVLPVVATVASMPQNQSPPRLTLRDRYYQLRIAIKYQGWLKILTLLKKSRRK